MVQLYYDKATGELCDRYPNFIAQNDKSGVIELNEENREERELYEKTCFTQWGYIWKVVNGKLKYCENFENDENYIKQEKKNTLLLYKSYLAETDYVIAKLQEAQLTATDEEYQAMKEEYSEILAKRKEARIKINELEAEE